MVRFVASLISLRRPFLPPWVRYKCRCQKEGNEVIERHTSPISMTLKRQPRASNTLELRLGCDAKICLNIAVTVLENVLNWALLWEDMVQLI